MQLSIKPNPSSMKTKTRNNLRLRALDHFVVRSPFLDPATWAAYRNQAGAARDAVAGGPSHWERRARSAARMFAEPNVNEAIFLASRSLHQRLGDTDWDMRDRANVKLLLAFERYLNRMCFRATPFGRFAGVAAGTVGPSCRSNPGSFGAPGGAPEGGRRARVDFAYLQSLWDEVVKRHPTIVRYRANSSVTALQGKLTYIDWSDPGTGETSYRLSEIDGNPVIVEVLAYCSARAALPSEIVRAFQDPAAGLGDNVLLELINDLIDANILLPELHVDPLDPRVESALCDFLLGHPDTQALGAALARLVAELADLADAGAAGVTARYTRIESALSELLPAYRGSLIRVDTVRSGNDVQLSKAFCDGLASDLGLLISKFGVEDLTLAGFRTRFVEKYGSSRVPFMALLKDELLMKDMHNASYPGLLGRLGLYKRARPDQYPRMNRYEKFLATKLVAARDARRPNVLEITPQDLEALPAQPGARPDQIFAIMTALRDEPEYQNNLISLMGIANADIATWQGRFCYALDASTEALGRTAAAIQDAEPDVIHAEISYMPSGDFGNIMTRPNFWAYRINLVEASASDCGREIPLSDILVAVQDDEVRIYSRTLGKRIVPHMSTAHNVEHPSNIAAYIFLRHLDTQGKLYSSFTWSGIFKSFDYLPRIQYKNIILSSERWVLKFANYARFAGEKTRESRAGFQRYLSHLGLPDFVEVKDGDNTLVLDTRDEIDADQLFRILKVKRRLIVQEVADADGMHTRDGIVKRHDLLLPLAIDPEGVQAREPDAMHARPAGRAAPLDELRDNVLAPLSEVVYAKVYLPEAEADGFLLDFQKKFIAHAREAGQSRQWFFVRYSDHNDPEHHLRLRFFPAHPDRFGALLADLVRMLEAYQRQGTVEKIELRNYEREVVRYGGPRWMGLSEQLFHLDSELALNIIAAAPQVERWKLATWAVHAFLHDLGLAAPEMHRCVLDMASRFKLEFGVAGEQLKLLGKQFRACADEMTAVVANTGQPVQWMRRLSISTEQLRIERREFLSRLMRARDAIGRDDFDSVIGSHMHMLCNRMFPSQPRAFEVLVYDTLERLIRPAALHAAEAQRLSTTS